MEHAPGLPRGGTAVLVTREVRWFQEGPLPDAVLEWFLTPECEDEQRTDHYDLDAARRGSGVKYRNETSLDAKFKLASVGLLELSAEVVGNVDDWVKASTLLESPARPCGPQYASVDKSLHTRTYVLHEASGPLPSGCEIELVSLSLGSTAAWSLCLETFGSPELRAEALDLGVKQLTGETPLPRGLELGRRDSYGYVTWLTRLAAAA
jgi:hypothetical protein